MTKIYNDLQDRIDQVPEWGDIPWGLGAWGSNNTTPRGKEIDQADREHCVLGVKELLESDEFKRLRAQIYFNSANCKVDEETYPLMVDTLQDLFDSSVHYPEDEFQFKFNKRWTCENKGGLCGNSCDSRCTYSYPKGDSMKFSSEHAICRCDPEGLEWSGIDVEGS